jgi:cytochrome P450
MGPVAEAFAEGLSEATLAEADEVLRRLSSSEEGKANPYPLYRELRELAPLYRSGLDGLWYASRYDDCKAVLIDPRCGRSRDRTVVRYGQSQAQVERFRRRQSSTMLLQNPPEHTRLRGLVSRAFTPKRVESLRPRIAELLEPLLDEMAEAGEVDVMAVLAFRLPVAVIGELVGVPPDEREQFRELVQATMAAGEPGAPPEVLEAADRVDDYMDGYFADLVARRRAHPTGDLLSGLIELRDEGGPLSEDEMLSTARLLFAAGFVTTTNLIGNGLLTFFRHPSEMQRLWDDPSLATTAVEEVLRYESVVQINGRAVFETIEVGGQVIPAGDTVLTLIGGANRDPARFSDPERFDIGRREETPLSFGWGIHHCLGAPLARLEGQIVFTRFVERFTWMELAGDEPGWNTSFLRGIDTLPVRVKPR